MKTEILSFSLFALLALTGCTVDPATGESALFGAIPISAETEDAALAAAENPRSILSAGMGRSTNSALLGFPMQRRLRTAPDAH